MSKENEPAFPSVYDYDQLPSTATVNNGMSLRTYLAGQAMMGLLASCTGAEFPDTARIAKYAVEAADNILAELNKTEK